MAICKAWLPSAAGVAAALTIGMSTQALADGFATRGAYSARASIFLNCDNGRTYPIRPRAVSVEGDMVTGHLITGHGRGVHIRLMPMGDGYRYAGLGIWFDGLRGNAVLNWGTPRAVNCTVTQE
jgi:hypothetical protein